VKRWNEKKAIVQDQIEYIKEIQKARENEERPWY
jgi:hypothetical protein